MASGTGTAIIDFGGSPGSNEASVAVTGLSGISATSKVDTFMMADNTSVDHTASDHRYLELFAEFTCNIPTAGVGFTIYGCSSEKMTGKFTLNYVWAD